jgi:hypothetical protein
MDIYEIRLKNLSFLLDEQFGGVRAALARKMEVGANNISRYYSSNKKDRRNIGDEFARGIETVCNKPKGWMDRVHDLAIDADKERLLELWEMMTEDERRQLLKIGSALSEK